MGELDIAEVSLHQMHQFDLLSFYLLARSLTFNSYIYVLYMYVYNLLPKDVAWMLQVAVEQ